jgi:hypothetical protein
VTKIQTADAAFNWKVLNPVILAFNWKLSNPVILAFNWKLSNPVILSGTERPLGSDVKSKDPEVQSFDHAASGSSTETWLCSSKHDRMAMEHLPILFSR